MIENRANFDFGLLIDFVVVVSLNAITFGLAILAHHDDRSGVGRLE